jgi:hypothetical protein
MADHWNGSKWALTTTRNPSNRSFQHLAAIACTSATSCTATGWEESGSDVLTLAEHWNGHTWAIETTPNRTAAVDSQMNGVACTSATNIAVGDYENSKLLDITLAEHWNGHTWALMTTPSP